METKMDETRIEKTSSIYPQLYHYTNTAGLYGILQSQNIWATHYKFLNDETEGELFKNKIREVISNSIFEAYGEILTSRKDKEDIEQKIQKEGGWGELLSEETDAMIRALYDSIYKMGGVYVASFCGTHKDSAVNQDGLLSQWRAYGHDGGYAIEFDTKKIENIIFEEFEKSSFIHSSLCDVVYDDDDRKFQEEIAPYMPRIKALAKDVAISAVDSEYIMNGTTAEAYTGLVSCAHRYKHKGFKEEHEVRIIVQPEKSKKVNFRDKENLKIPYIEIFKDKNLKLPIQKIIVGPHKDKIKRYESLKEMLRGKDVEVIYSSIPYIG